MGYSDENSANMGTKTLIHHSQKTQEILSTLTVNFEKHSLKFKRREEIKKTKLVGTHNNKKCQTLKHFLERLIVMKFSVLGGVKFYSATHNHITNGKI